jgi:hypothetical protein
MQECVDTAAGAALLLLLLSAGPSVFDLLVAADVFVYIGDLQPVLQAAADAAADRSVMRLSVVDCLRFCALKHANGDVVSSPWTWTGLQLPVLGGAYCCTPTCMKGSG